MARKAVLVVVVVVAIFLLLVLVGLLGSLNEKPSIPPRSEVIPATAVKQSPAMDIYPPILRSDDWETPIPMPGPVNTAGAEDSPFITSNGTWFFFFFTPDLNIPIQQQLGDKVTGVWWTRDVDGTWTEPERLVLGSMNSLEGDEFVEGDSMWFGSVRTGNLGEIDIYSATFEDGEWTNVQNAGEQLNVEMDIGAFCFTPDGSTLYYAKSGDIMKTVKSAGLWATPSKVQNIDSVSGKNQPFVTADGNELWFTGNGLTTNGPSVFRCTKNGSGWDSPEEIVASFAAEPALDAEGNLYFVHHYVTQNISLIEADIYVAYRKSVSTSSLEVPSEVGQLVLASGYSVVFEAAEIRDGAMIATRTQASS
jgi:hypothetical protein